MKAQNVNKNEDGKRDAQGEKEVGVGTSWEGKTRQGAWRGRGKQDKAQQWH